MSRVGERVVEGFVEFDAIAVSATALVVSAVNGNVVDGRSRWCWKD